MKTITKKTAKNGATLYYIDGKRTSRADAMYWQRQNENERKYLARIEAEKTFSDAMSEVDAAVEAEIEIVNNAEEIAEINAADVKVNVADNGKVIEQIKVDVDTAINIINRLNYRNDTFVYSNTTRYDNADIQCRHFDAYKADGESDAFAITEIVINGKLEIVRFFNLFRDITVDLQIGNVNYTIGDKGAIVLTDAEEIVDDNADEETVGITDADIVEATTVTSKVNGALSADPNADNFTEAKFITYAHAKDPRGINYAIRSTDFIRAEHALTLYKDALADKAAEYEFGISHADSGSPVYDAPELDGSEEDIDGDNAFDYLPALDELNDVDIDEDTPEVDPAEYAINAEEYAREIPQYNPCSQIKQFFIGDTENHRAELVTFEGDRWEIIKSNYYGAEMYNGTDNKIHFIVGEFYDDTTGKYFPELERGMNTTDADEFFSIMQERGACTIDEPDIDAEKLTAELKDVTRKSKLIDIYPQVGQRIVDNLYKVEIRPDSDGFIFTNGHETLARYDTKEQCQAVIEQIKTAVDFGDNEFAFPQAADVELELKLPALMIEQFNKYRYRAKGRSVPRRFLAAQLKYYGLNFADLRAERR